MGDITSQVLAITNQKGGVGKTTTALTLGAALVLCRKKTLVIDLDPHASATIHLTYYSDAYRDNVLDIFLKEELSQEDILALIKKDKRHFFDFIPGSIKLATVEGELKERKSRGLYLKKTLSKISANYDFIILDCPPNFGIILINALVASTLTVIPIQTEFLALHGLKLTFDTIRMLNRVLNRKIEYKALATMYDQRVGACRRVVQVLQKTLKEKMFNTIISVDSKFREASARGEIIYNLYPKSRGAKQYLQLAKEILSWD